MNHSFEGFGERERRALEALLPLALAEDLGAAGDLTSLATVPADARGAGLLVARSPGVLAGLPVLERLAVEFGTSCAPAPGRRDGDQLAPGTPVARLSGPMRSVLAMERLALNFLQRLSGTATLTARFVAAIADTRTRIYDTRKTTPGLRALEKYAVRCGGGFNHRFGLFDAVLIKDNHLAWLGLHAPNAAGRDEAGRETSAGSAVAEAVAAARAGAPSASFLEIEVDSLEQLDAALACRPDIVLLDNFGPELAAEAVRRRDARAPAVQLEASGGVGLETVAALAAAGVDRISVGALTHSAPALDLALDFAFGPSIHVDGETPGDSNDSARDARPGPPP